MRKVFTDILLVLAPKEKKKFFQFTFFSFLISFADISALVLLLLIINFYIQPETNSYMDFLPGWLTDRSSVALIAGFLILFSLKNFLAFLVHKYQYRFVYSVASRISEKNLSHFLHGTFSEYVNIDSSVHIHRISHQPAQFSNYLLAGMQEMITQCILVLLTTLAILFFNVKLFLILLIILLPAVLLSASIVKKKIRTARKYIKTSNEKTQQYLNEALNGYIESNIYNKHDFFKNRYTNAQQELHKYLCDLQIIQGVPTRLIEVFAIAGLFLLIALNQWLNSNITDLITIGAFIAAAYKIIPGIVKIMNLNGQLQTYAHAATDLLPLKELIQPLENTNTANDLSLIQFKNVSFRYKDEMVLSNVNLLVQPGDFCGITGLSGRGKTTLLNLLLGFIKPDSGNIYINDETADNLKLREHWSTISYVKQQNFLIYDTLVKNIILSNEPYDEKRLNEVIRITGLEELINNDTNGINKMIVENGKNISGGQRQRIAIARALYKNSDLYLLDEPFNELDESSIECFLQHFRSLSEAGKVVILITHDTKSLGFCNKIFSLDES